MFKAFNISCEFVYTIYAVKTMENGSTCFLVYDSKWHWDDAIYYKPLEGQWYE